MHVDHSEARVIKFEIKRNWASFRAVRTSDTVWNVDSRAIEGVDIFGRCFSDKERREAREGNVTGDTDIFFGAVRVGFLELGRQSSDPSLAWGLLSIAIEECTFATVHYLLQIYTVDLNWAAISLLRIIDEQIVQVIESCRQSEMTVNSRYM